MPAEFKTTWIAARTGDRHAFETLFERHLPALTAFLRCKVDGELARHESIRDLAQSVCREVLSDLDEFEYRGEEAFRGWLFLQATRKIVDRYRYHRRERRAAPRDATPLRDDGGELLEQYATIHTPSRHAAGAEEVLRIEAALRTLPEAQRDAILLSRLTNLSYAEVAAQQGTSESAVRGLVARGLAKLAEILDREQRAAGLD